MILRFASPEALWLLIVPLAMLFAPLVVRRWQWLRERQQPATLQYSDLRLMAQISPSLRQRGRIILPFLRLVALSVLIVALARPQLGNAREVISGQGVDIAIVLDISGSMAAEDFEPNRISAAKEVIREFINQRKYDRIGFVIFATEAFSQVPPTLDYRVLEQILDQTQVSWDIGLDSGTAIGLGLSNGANMLRDSTAESKVIVLLTDGANNSGQIDPMTAAKIAKALNISIPTVILWKLRWLNGKIELDRIEKEEPWKLKRSVSSLIDDAYRAGRTPIFSMVQQAAIVYLSLQTPGSVNLPVSHWSPRLLAEKAKELKIVEKYQLDKSEDICNKWTLKCINMKDG